MKAHTQTFKENLITLGKEINAKVTYTIDGVTTELGGDELGSVTPHYEGNILKSVMKQVDIVSDVDIPIGTIINVQFGMRYNTDEYEYIDYGNYIVNKSEKQEDTNNYKIIAYDKMLYAMKDYEELDITYPITIRNYINTICTKIGLTFANINDTFANYDKEIKRDLYKDLGYTYRDILDELAQVTASTICINKDDQLEIRYLNESVNDSEEVEGTNLTLTDSESAKISGVVVEGKTTQDGTPTPDTPIPIENVTGLQDIQVCGKNLNNVLYSNIHLLPNWDGTTVLNNYYNSVIVDTRNVNSIYVSGDFSTIESGGIRTGKYNDYPSTSTTGTRISFPSSGSINTTNVNYVLLSFQPASGKTFTDIQNSIQIEYGNQASEFEEYKNKSYEINLGKNLYEGSQDFSGTWNNANQWTTDSETYNGLVVKKRNSAWNGLSKDINIKKGETYTFSLYAKSDVSRPVAIYIGGGITNISVKDFNTTTEWARYSITFVCTADGVAKIRLENRTAIADSYTYICGYQIEKGTQMTSYSPYFEPIELNKISTYKDLIFKGKGVNLFDISTSTLGKYIDTSGNLQTTSNSDTSDFIQIKGGQRYTISWKYISPLNSSSYREVVLYNNNKEFVSTLTLINMTSGHIDFLPTQDGYIKFDYDKKCYDIMLEVGNQISRYEPYNAKDKWVLHKEIGKAVLDGSESWSYQSNVNAYYHQQNDFIRLSNYTNAICSNYYASGVGQSAPGDYYITGYSSSSYQGQNWIYIRNVDMASASDLKTWLSTHNTIVYYVLNTPTTTEITNDNYPELLSQLKALDKAKTYEGTTNITSSFPIKFSYATDYETINEDYIKNTRASFGEKYGPINSIVLSRSAESDNIYIQDEESIEENGLCEVKIKDNQILNDNNRNEFLDDLLEYLGGIEYYTNDYESIGITYLDLCDKYKVQIGDTKYDCIMFNDEVDIHDGLNEIIYTDKPKEEVTDYKKATTTDKLQRQTNLIVDKQNQRIEAIVSDSEDSFASINVELGRISSQVQGYEVTIDELGNEIQTLRSSYTEQTPTMISDWFDTNLKSIVDDLQNTTSGNDEEIRKIKAYIRRGVITDPQSPYYNQAYIELGDETNQTTLRILQNRIQFLTNGQETAFISNNQLYINESTILTKEKVGHWVTTEDEDGLLNTYWED